MRLDILLSLGVCLVVCWHGAHAVEHSSQLRAAALTPGEQTLNELYIAAQKAQHDNYGAGQTEKTKVHFLTYDQYLQQMGKHDPRTVAQLHARHKEQGIIPVSYHLFSRFDADRDGQLNYKEFSKLITFMNSGYLNITRNASEVEYTVTIRTASATKQPVYIKFYGSRGRTSHQLFLSKNGLTAGKHVFKVKGSDVLWVDQVRVRLGDKVPVTQQLVVTSLEVALHGRHYATQSPPIPIWNAMHMLMFPNEPSLSDKFEKQAQGAPSWDTWTKKHYALYQKKAATFRAWMKKHMAQQRAHNKKIYGLESPTAAAKYKTPIDVKKVPPKVREAQVKAQRTASKEAGVKLHKQREAAVKKMAKSESAVKAKAKERKKKDKEFTTKERARKAKLAAKQRKESASKKENLKKEQAKKTQLEKKQKAAAAAEAHAKAVKRKEIASKAAKQRLARALAEKKAKKAKVVAKEQAQKKVVESAKKRYAAQQKARELVQKSAKKQEEAMKKHAKAMKAAESSLASNAAKEAKVKSKAQIASVSKQQEKTVKRAQASAKAQHQQNKATRRAQQLGEQEKLMQRILREAKEQKKRQEREQKQAARAAGASGTGKTRAKDPTLKQRQAAQRLANDLKGMVKGPLKKTPPFHKNLDPVRYGEPHPNIIPSTHKGLNTKEHMLAQHTPGMYWGGNVPGKN